MYNNNEEKNEAIATIMGTLSYELLESFDDKFVREIASAIRAGKSRIELRAKRKIADAATRVERNAFYAGLAEENDVGPETELAANLRSMVYQKSKGDGDSFRRDLYAEIVDDARALCKELFMSSYDGYEDYTDLIWEGVN